jgi:Gluconate 2-dehydrogenase subunit 3
MKRRQAIQALLGAPAMAAIPLPAIAQEMPKLATSTADAVGDPSAHYFSNPQMAALRRLGDLVVPATGGRPGARDAKAAEFLDFLIGQSSADRQSLYHNGLDHLQSEARSRFSTAFESLTPQQADLVLAPLHAAWTYGAPADPFAAFLREAKEDLIAATMNSREYSEAQAASGRRGTGVGTYWYPVE